MWDHVIKIRKDKEPQRSVQSAENPTDERKVSTWSNTKLPQVDLRTEKLPGSKGSIQAGEMKNLKVEMPWRISVSNSKKWQNAVFKSGNRNYHTDKCHKDVNFKNSGINQCLSITLQTVDPVYSQVSWFHKNLEFLCSMIIKINF